jgi:hypothetical protein
MLFLLIESHLSNHNHSEPFHALFNRSSRHHVIIDAVHDARQYVSLKHRPLLEMDANGLSSHQEEMPPIVKQRACCLACALTDMFREVQCDTVFTHGG